MQKLKRCFRFFISGSTVFFTFINFTPIPKAFAVPIDWKGSFGVNTTTIDNYRRTSDPYGSTANGSQFIAPAPGNHKDASFQNYVFDLSPTVIVNDSVSVHGEITTGYDRGGFLGDSTTQKKEGTPKAYGDALYLHNTSNGTANLNLTKIYMELFTDTCTVLLGRQPFHWGLGAIWNKGENVWDHYSTIQDGITAKFKIGNFHITPYYAKINSFGSLTKASQTSALGFTLLYDNLQRDLTFGLLFGKRESGANNTFYNSGITGTPLGSAEVKTTDFYLKKTFGKFALGLEVPLFSGDLGNVYYPEQNTKIKSQAIIGETSFVANENWTFGLNFGSVSGDDGQGSTFDALYLNPNYQIANLMFRYNLNAVSSTGENVYDSYIVNARYLKFYSLYQVEAWTWTGGVVVAKANETAQVGSIAFDHTKNKTFTSNYKQSDNLGWELDLGAKYQWNPNVTLNGDFGYHFVGDYYAYTNSTPAKLHNSYVLLGALAVQF